MATATKKITNQFGKVELVSGPLDGAIWDWPLSDRVIKIEYYGGWAQYELELNNKTAFWIKG